MKLRHLIPILLLALCILAAPAAAAGGAGTASNPYVIQTPAELQSIQNDLSAYYVLGNDIDMSGYSFVPIGSTSAPFFGALDGRGHTIRNLNINLPDTTHVGLFSVITSGATIRDIIFEDCTVYSYTTCGMVYGMSTAASSTSPGIIVESVDMIDCKIGTYRYYVGGIGGQNTARVTGTLNDCHIINCTISSEISTYIGGIVGYLAYYHANMSILNSSVINSNIQGDGIIGGIVGACAEGNTARGSILNCIVDNCIISGSGSSIGGVCGYVSHTSPYESLVVGNKVTNCIISGSGSSIGGVSGYSSNNGGSAYISGNILNYCTIKGNTEVGGISGRQLSAGQISDNSVENSSIIANSYAAGICPRFG